MNQRSKKIFSFLKYIILSLFSPPHPSVFIVLPVHMLTLWHVEYIESWQMLLLSERKSVFQTPFQLISVRKQDVFQME